MDPQFDQAASVDEKSREPFKILSAGFLKGFDGEIVCDEHRNPPVLDLFQQALVRPVEDGMTLMQQFDVEVSFAGRDRFGPAGVDAEHVAFLDDDVILRSS